MTAKSRERAQSRLLDLLFRAEDADGEAQQGLLQQQQQQQQIQQQLQMSHLSQLPSFLQQSYQESSALQDDAAMLRGLETLRMRVLRILDPVDFVNYSPATPSLSFLDAAKVNALFQSSMVAVPGKERIELCHVPLLRDSLLADVEAVLGSHNASRQVRVS